MKTLPGLFIAITITGVVFTSCNEASFGGGAGPKGGTSTDSSRNPGGTDAPGGALDGEDGADGGSAPLDGGDGASVPPGPDQECINGGNTKLPFPPQIQACIDQGKMWNFEAQECTKMRKASFECNFESFFAKMRELGMEPSAKLLAGQAGNPTKAVIIGCGESEKADTILIQWFFLPQGSTDGCNVTQIPGKISTGCYGEDSGPAGASEEEQKRIVLACMNGMAQ